MKTCFSLQLHKGFIWTNQSFTLNDKTQLLCLLQEIGVKRELVSREPQTQYMVRGVSNKCRGLSTKTGEGSWRALLLHEMARENLADTVTVEQISEDEKGSGVGA